MTAYFGGCLGPGTDSAYCICSCHLDPSNECDDGHCAPVSAKAADNTRLRHINRDPDKGKMTTRRGHRSMRKG